MRVEYAVKKTTKVSLRLQQVSSMFNHITRSSSIGLIEYFHFKVYLLAFSERYEKSTSSIRN